MKRKGLLCAGIVSIFSTLFVWAQETTPATPSPTESTTTSSAPVVVPMAPANVEVPGNLLRNGNFERGKSDWKSPGKVITVDGRNVLELDTTRREPQTLATDWKTVRDVRVLKISFEVKAGEGFVPDSAVGGDIHCEISKLPRGASFRDVSIKPGGGWQTICWNREVPAGQRTFVFQITARPGSGPLYLSNFVVLGEE